MDVTNKTLAKDPANANDVRIRISQHGALAKRFLDVMGEYKVRRSHSSNVFQDIQKKYQDRYKQRMQRQYRIVKPNATPSEIKQVLENKNEKNAQIFAQQVVSSGQKTEAKRALQDIQDRHTDIIRLEKSILVGIVEGLWVGIEPVVYGYECTGRGAGRATKSD
jgi:t-SNARE complex subunit (syntaxin)